MKQKITSNREYGTGSIEILRKRVRIYTAEGDALDFQRSEFEPPLSDLLAKLEGHRLDPARYTVSADNSILYSFAPASGSHVVRFQNFAAQKDSLPAPKLQTGGPRTGKDGRKWNAPDKMVFTAILEILSGNFEGCTLAYQLDYLFERDGKEAMIAGGKTANAKLSAFLQVVGLDLTTLTIPWPKDGNVLPFLEEEMLESDAVFQVVLKDGWIDSVADLPVGFGKPKKAKVTLEEEEEPEEDELSDEQILAAAKAARAAKKQEAAPEAKKALRKAVEAAESAADEEEDDKPPFEPDEDPIAKALAKGKKAKEELQAMRKAREAKEEEDDEPEPAPKPGKKVSKPVEPAAEAEDDEEADDEQPAAPVKHSKPAPANSEAADEVDDGDDEETGDEAVDFFSKKAAAKRAELDKASSRSTAKVMKELYPPEAGDEEEAEEKPAPKKRRAF